jgi:hypothetical protein
MTEDIRVHERNEKECRDSMQALAEQMDAKDLEIETLGEELELQRKRTRDVFKESMKRSKPLKQPDFSSSIKEGAISDELQEMRDLVEEMQEELDYGKQRENKLMFFLFVLKEKGFPISEVFEQEIKDIPTTRFST